LVGCGSSHATSGARGTDTRNPTGATFPAISAGDAASLYRPKNFGLTLSVAEYYLGPDRRLRSLRLIPGGVDFSVDLGDGLGKDISVDSTGGYLSGPTVKLSGEPRSFPLSSVDRATPSKLAKLLDGRVDHMVANPDSDGLPTWLAFPAGGGAPTHLTPPARTRPPDPGAAVPRPPA
jgi:hypothetical protein